MANPKRFPKSFFVAIGVSHPSRPYPEASIRISRAWETRWASERGVGKRNSGKVSINHEAKSLNLDDRLSRLSFIIHKKPA